MMAPLIAFLGIGRAEGWRRAIREAPRRMLLTKGIALGLTPLGLVLRARYCLRVKSSWARDGGTPGPVAPQELAAMRPAGYRPPPLFLGAPNEGSTTCAPPPLPSTSTPPVRTTGSLWSTTRRNTPHDARSSTRTRRRGRKNTDWGRTSVADRVSIGDPFPHPEVGVME